MENRQMARRATDAIFDDSLPMTEAGYGRNVHNALQFLSVMCQHVVGGRLDDQGTLLKDAGIDVGMAISPRKAAYCLTDVLRTHKFVLGLHDAIKEAQRRFSGEKIRVLYVGTGPFASLALLVCSKFSPDEVSFTGIDIHENSVDNALRIVRAFGYEEYFERFIQADATRYHHDGPEPHVIVSETMDTGLLHEPQAAITVNLAPQMAENGIWVPEKVTVTFYLRPCWEQGQAASPDGRIAEQTVVELTADSAKRFGKRILDVDVSLRIPPLDTLHDAYLGSQVQVFGKHEFPFELSGTSCGPERIIDISNCRNEQRMRIRYALGATFIDPRDDISWEVAA